MPWVREESKRRASRGCAEKCASKARRTAGEGSSSKRIRASSRERGATGVTEAEKSHREAAAMPKRQCRAASTARSEKRAPDSDDGASLRDRSVQIATHAHRELRQGVPEALDQVITDFA